MISYDDKPSRFGDLQLKLSDAMDSGMALVSWCEWSTTREVARTVPCLINQQVRLMGGVILASQGQVRLHNYVQFQQGFAFK